MSKFFRCENPDCATRPDFEAEHPVCPDCGADGRTHPGLATELTPVHYLVKDAKGPIRTAIGQRAIACAPARARLFRSCSGDRTAVTCPKCRASEVYRAHEAGGVDQHEDFAEKKLAAEHGLKVVPQQG